MADERSTVVDLDSLQPGSVRHATLPASFIVRAKLVQHAFGDAAVLDFAVFVENFQRDADPMKELIVWERIASAFLSLTSNSSTRAERRAISEALLQVSMLWPQIRESPPADALLRSAVEAYANAGSMPALSSPLKKV